MIVVELRGRLDLKETADKMVIQSILPALFNLTLKPYDDIYCL